MSKTENNNSNKTAATAQASGATAAATAMMTAEEATIIILAPYVTEKTFNQIERENKLSFMVAEHASKHQIIEAMRVLYEIEVSDVNTARTIQGKKAFVKFEEPEGARNLATKLGLV